MRSFTAQFEAIGTSWEIRVHHDGAASWWQKQLLQLHATIDEFDRTYSRFREDSWVTQLSREAGRFSLPEDAAPLLQFYREVYDATDGKVTPLIGQAMADAGYDASYSFVPSKLTPPPAWDDAIVMTKNTLTVNQPTLLDFGAAGKGYLVDLIGAQIERAGVQSFVISAGGDIVQRTTSGEDLQVGLENPVDVTEAIGIASISNQSICASSVTKRQWGKFHHIIDPTTLRSTETIMATWVVAATTMVADGLATALFFAQPQALQKHFKFSYAMLTADMQMIRSHNFPANLFEAAHAAD